MILAHAIVEEGMKMMHELRHLKHNAVHKQEAVAAGGEPS